MEEKVESVGLKRGKGGVLRGLSLVCMVIPQDDGKGRPRDIDVSLGMEEDSLLLQHPWKMLLAYR